MGEMRHSGPVLACIVATGVFACSSGSGSASGGSGPSGTCESVCAKALELACPNDTQQKCEADCQADYSAYDAAGCSAYAASELGCLQTKATFHCGSNGEASVDSQQVLSVCKSEATALAGCAACVQEANDGACDTCLKTSCCSERKAAFSDPAVIDASLCAQACSDSACVSACLSKYPSAQSKITAMQSCESSKCSTAC